MSHLFMFSSNALRAAGLAAICAVGIEPVRAEPVLDRALSGLRLIERKACSIVKIDFNLRIRHTSHFPIERGSELRIAVKAIDPAQVVALSLLKREALRAPTGSQSGITAIDFETANGSPASACAVGLVRIRDGAVVERATWRIRPPGEQRARGPRIGGPASFRSATIAGTHESRPGFVYFTVWNPPPAPDR